MPDPETASLEQYAVLWPILSYNGNGDPVLDDPVEIAVRWETDRREAVSRDATPIGVTSTVYVDQEIAEGSQMWKGRLDNLDDDSSPLHTVISYDEIPDIKGDVSQRTVTLMRI